MFGFFSRMSFFKKNLLFSSVNILLLGLIFAVSSFFIQDRLMLDILTQQARGIATQSMGSLSPTDLKEALTNHDLNGDLQKRLVTQLDNMTNTNNNIAQGYVFSPPSNGSSDHMMIALPSHLLKEGLKPGDLYQQPETFAEAMQQAMDSKEIANTEVYQDMLGTWISVAVPILDDQKNIVAIFGIDIDASIVAEGKQNTLTWLGATVVGFLIVSIAVQFVITRRLLEPLKMLFTSINQLGTGNLDVQMEVKSNDEIGELGRSFNSTVEQLKLVIRQVKETSQLVDESSERFVEIADKTTIASNRITSSMQEVATGLEHQMSSSEESAQATEYMTTNIQRIAENSRHVSGASEEAATEAKDGGALVQNAIRQMESINTSVDESAAIVQSMNKRSQDIEQIVSVITDISSQTNLLALNAAIEASRAGEHGRGFAVVADEVRKLAEQSTLSARQIAELIKGIQGDSKMSVHSMNKVTSEVKIGMREMLEVGKVFKRIIEAIEGINTQMQQMTVASRQMSDGSSQISDSVSMMTDIAKDSASRSNEVAKASQEQLALVEEISLSANSLSRMSRELQELVSKFKV